MALGECNTCGKRETCTEMCVDLKHILDQMSMAYFRAYYFEIPVEAVNAEYLNSVAIPREFLLSEEEKAHKLLQEKQFETILRIIETKLPEHYRQILYGYFFEKEKQKTLAKRLGITQPTVSFRIQQALKEIKKYIKKSDLQ